MKTFCCLSIDWLCDFYRCLHFVELDFKTVGLLVNLSFAFTEYFSFYKLTKNQPFLKVKNFFFLFNHIFAMEKVVNES